MSDSSSSSSLVELEEVRAMTHPNYGEAFVTEPNMNGVNERGNVREASPEHPVYRRVPMDIYDPPGTRLWLINCNEGWRESIVCTHMYEWTAEWLVQQIQGKPFAPGKH